MKASILVIIGLTIPIVGVIRDQPGTVQQVAEITVTADIADTECDVTSSGDNNSSTHEGNDLRVTADNVVNLRGVEDVPGATTTGDARLQTGPEGSTITVELVMGPDGVFSADLGVDLRCDGPVPTTTTTVPSVTTTSTTVPATTTTEPTPSITSTSTSTTTVPATTTTEPPSTTTTEPPSTTTSTTTSTTVPTTVTIPPIIPRVPDPTPIIGTPTFTG